MILIQQDSFIVIISKFGKNIKKKHSFRPRQASTSPRAGSCGQNQYFCPLERGKYAGHMAEEQKELDDLKALMESQQDTLSEGMSAMTTKVAALLEKLDRKVELSCSNIEAGHKRVALEYHVETVNFDPEMPPGIFVPKPPPPKPSSWSRLREGRNGSGGMTMGSSLRGGAATDATFLGVPFAKGAGGACRDHVGIVNWDPGARSGVVPATLIASACRSARDIVFPRTTLRGAK